MSIEILKKDSFAVSEWSGGTTTELFIYPKNSEYRKKDFLFRLSSATVDDEYSVFTKLPEISRVIAILDGEIIINHENRYSKNLKKNDTDFFEGDWYTTSEGKARDFNLMMKKEVTGSVKAISMNFGRFFLELEKESKFNFIYISSGNCSFLYKGKEYFMKNGDLAVFYNEKEQLTFISDKECSVIFSFVKV